MCVVAKSACWDDAPLKFFKKDLKIEVRECRRKYVVEIDNYSELVMIDPSYAGSVPALDQLNTNYHFPKFGPSRVDGYGWG